MNLEIYSDEIIANRTQLTSQITGIYFLYRNEEIVYIGQSRNLHRRIIQHCYGKEFDSYSYIQCDESELNDLEFEFIAKHKPMYNSLDGLKSTHYKTLNYFKVRLDYEKFKELKKFIKRNKIFPSIFSYYDIRILKEFGYQVEAINE